MDRKSKSLRDLTAGDSDSESSDERAILARMMSVPNLFNGSASSDSDDSDESETPPRSRGRKTAVSPVRKPNRSPNRSPNRTPITSRNRTQMKSPNDKRSLPKMSPKVIGANLRRTLKKTGASARNLLTPTKKEPKTWQDDLHLPKNVTKDQAMAILLAKELGDMDI